MYTKQQKSALTREINSMKNEIEHVTECFSRQTPDRDGMVWYAGQKKHAEGYLRLLTNQLNRMISARAEMDGKQPVKVAVPVIETKATEQKAEDKATKIEAFMLENNVTLTDIVDVVISNNGIIGVGLITLGNELRQYVHGKINANPEAMNF